MCGVCSMCRVREKGSPHLSQASVFALLHFFSSLIITAHLTPPPLPLPPTGTHNPHTQAHDYHCHDNNVGPKS